MAADGKTGMVRIGVGARLFGERVARAYGDPRSRVHFDDARRFFASGQRRYDVKSISRQLTRCAPEIQRGTTSVSW